MLGVLIIVSVFLSGSCAAYLLLSRVPDQVIRRYAEIRIETVRLVEQLFVFIPAARLSALTLGSAAVFFIAAVAGTAAVPWPLRLALVAGAAAIGLWVPRAVVRHLLQRRIRLVERQLIDGLSLLSSGLRAGMSFIQVVDLVVKEMPPPLSQEFGLVLREHKMGASLDDALHHLLTRVPSQEFHLLVTAVLLTKEAGGNLSEIFDRIALTIRERNKVKGRMDALTAQGKIQGITVGLLPVALGCILYAIDPELMRPVLTTPPGWAGLGVAASFELVGFMMIRKISAIEA